MGNIITLPNGDLIDSKLKTIITEWAKNDYDAGLNYNKDDITPRIKKLLLKRACCIKKPNMMIALPKCTIANNNIGVEDIYAPVNIQDLYINEKYKETCNRMDNIDNNNYAQPDNYVQGASMADTQCEALYNSTGDVKGLCEKVRYERAQQTNNQSDISYSKYKDDKQNVYADCNCINSVLRNSKGIDASNKTINPNILAQLLDNRCSGIIPNVYNTAIAQVNGLCINQINTSDTNLDKSALNFSQNCGSNKQPLIVVEGVDDSTGVARSALPTSTLPTSTGFNSLFIIIPSIVIILMFVYLFII